MQFNSELQIHHIIGTYKNSNLKPQKHNLGNLFTVTSNGQRRYEMTAEHTGKETDDEAADINDIFYSIALSEERLAREGFQEGFRKGCFEGEVEGFHLGYHRGAEIGAEIGYYKGVVETLLVISDKRKQNVPAKVFSALQKVSDLINQFPTSNVDDVDIVAARDNVRARFKKACALLKIEGTFPELSRFSF